MPLSPTPKAAYELNKKNPGNLNCSVYTFKKISVIISRNENYILF